MVIKTGEVIEDYPKDARGHSCLMLGVGQDDRAIHMVCAPKDSYLANPDQWMSDFRRRL